MASVQRGWAGCTGEGNLYQRFISFLAIFPTEYLGKPAGKFTNGVHVMGTGTNFKCKSVAKKPAYNHMTARILGRPTFKGPPFVQYHRYFKNSCFHVFYSFNMSF